MSGCGARSAQVHQTFLDLGDHEKMPKAVMDIAQRLDLPLLKASAVLCIAWRFYKDILVDRELFDAAKILFPDRSVHLCEDAADLLADRVFYLNRRPCARHPARQVRCAHTVDSIVALDGAVVMAFHLRLHDTVAITST